MSTYTMETKYIKLVEVPSDQIAIKCAIKQRSKGDLGLIHIWEEA